MRTGAMQGRDHESRCHSLTSAEADEGSVKLRSQLCEPLARLQRPERLGRSSSMTALSELADLGVLLAMICVPLAVGAIAIPIGRALADRVRTRGGVRPSALPSEDRLATIEAQVRRLERALAPRAADTVGPGSPAR